MTTAYTVELAPEAKGHKADTCRSTLSKWRKGFSDLEFWASTSSFS